MTEPETTKDEILQDIAEEVVEQAVEIVETRARDRAWNAIFEKCNFYEHDFDTAPVSVNSAQIKAATRHLETTAEREVRIICKQDTRESRPRVFVERNLFILPTKNGVYSIIKGEGYLDIPPIKKTTEVYNSQLDFQLDTAKVGNSEMQHLDFAYASSLIRTFLDDKSLVLTIRGRKYTPEFEFFVGKHKISTSSVQTEVDAGYEGRTQVALIEAKSTGNKNTIIRQLYYPFRQWQTYTKKKVVTLFFEKFGNEYSLWEFQFTDVNDYNSIQVTRAQKFVIKDLSTPPVEDDTKEV
jgi:hypothetical protein